MPNPVYETMTRYVTPVGFVIRVWREEPMLTYGPDPEVLATIEQCKGDRADFNGIMAQIGAMPRVAAVEFLTTMATAACSTLIGISRAIRVAVTTGSYRGRRLGRTKHAVRPYHRRE
jgi:hypothetical protein